ncbi:MAG: class I SAM-dependent methyltransferase [Bacteroidia bacterium]
MKEINNNISYNNCPACGSQNIVSKGNLYYNEPLVYGTIQIKLLKNPYLVYCNNCKSYFTGNAIPENDSIELYTNSNSSERWQAVDFTKDKPLNILKTLNKYFKHAGNLLDIGCNYGLLLDYAKQLGNNTYGIEYSSKSIEIILNKGHKHIEKIIDYNEYFDVITAFDLVEHLYDVNKFFNECHAALKTNGVLVIFTGNPQSLGAKLAKNNWWYFNFAEHINFLSENYYKKYLKLFTVETYQQVYNSNYFKNMNYNIVSLLQLKKLLFKPSSQKPYNGLPSLLPDHHLIILRKS